MNSNGRSISRRDVLKTSGVLAAGLAASSCSLGIGRQDQTQSKGSGGGGKTRVRFLAVFWLAEELKLARQMVEEFNAQSKHVEVQYVQGSWASIETKMTVAFSSGDVPEVFQYYDAGLVPWGENGLLTDLKTMLPDSTWADVRPGTLSALTSPKAGVLGLPFEAETPLIYYNTQMLDRAGIAPATLENRWSWDELRTHATALADPGRNVFGVTTSWASSQILFKHGLGWQAGATPIREKDGSYRIDVSDKGDQTSVAYLTDLFSGKAADVKGLAADAVSGFLSGRAAMLVTGAWGRTQLPTTKVKNPVQWKTMPFTIGPTKNLGSGAAQTLNIPAAAKNKEAAAEFLTWWGKPDNVARICKVSGQIPPNIKAVDLLAKDVGSDDAWKYALAEAQELQGQPYCPGWLAMLSKVWDPAMYAVFRGQRPIGDFTSKVNKDGTSFVKTAAGEK